MILGNRLLHTTCSARETEKIGKILKMQPGLEFFQLPCRTKLISDDKYLDCVRKYKEIKLLNNANVKVGTLYWDLTPITRGGHVLRARITAVKTDTKCSTELAKHIHELIEPYNIVPNFIVTDQGSENITTINNRI